MTEQPRKKIYVCRFCNVEFTEEERNDPECMLKHAFSKHLDLLTELAIGLMEEVNQ